MSVESGGKPTPAPLSGAAPRVFAIENSVCKASPARLVIIGYQRYPNVYASMFPRLLGVDGNACWDILMNSLRCVRISCGFT